MQEVFQFDNVIFSDTVYDEITIPESLTKIIEWLPSNEKLEHIITTDEGDRFISMCKKGEFKLNSGKTWIQLEKEIIATGIDSDSLANLLIQNKAFHKIKRENERPLKPILKAFDKSLKEQSLDLIPKQLKIIKGQHQKKLVLNYDVLEKRLHNKSLISKKFAIKRLKFLSNLCSKNVKNDKISLRIVNNLANFCLEIIHLIESEKIVMPTAFEFSLIVKWYFDRQTKLIQEPAVILTTVCPDYPYELVENEAVYTGGLLGDDIGIIGESIMKSAPHFLEVLSKTLKISFHWIVAYAGFEAKEKNLKAMNISFDEFTTKIKTSAIKLQKKMNTPVGILPESVGLTLDQFDKIRDSFAVSDFQIHRVGMDALSQAIDARDWACIYTIANSKNAIILDGASVYMGRKAYRKTEKILNKNNCTPMFFCVSNYKGFK